MCDAATEYVAVFCPHCGNHLNELDEQDELADPRPLWGSTYTCAWCQKRTSDWRHVLRCRKTWPARAELIRRQNEEAVRLGVRAMEQLAETLNSDEF